MCMLVTGKSQLLCSPQPLLGKLLIRETGIRCGVVCVDCSTGEVAKIKRGLHKRGLCFVQHRSGPVGHWRQVIERSKGKQRHRERRRILHLLGDGVGRGLLRRGAEDDEGFHVIFVQVRP